MRSMTTSTSCESFIMALISTIPTGMQSCFSILLSVMWVKDSSKDILLDLPIKKKKKESFLYRFSNQWRFCQLPIISICTMNSGLGELTMERWDYLMPQPHYLSAISPHSDQLSTMAFCYLWILLAVQSKYLISFRKSGYFVSFNS